MCIYVKAHVCQLCHVFIEWCRIFKISSRFAAEVPHRVLQTARLPGKDYEIGKTWQHREMSPVQKRMRFLQQDSINRLFLRFIHQEAEI